MKKNFPVILGAVALFLFAGMMVYSALLPIAASGQEQNPGQQDFCTYDENNIYMNPDLSTEDIMQLYHETINEKFNTYIKMMLQGQKAAATSNRIDENNQPPEDDTCPENNYSTFCVAKTLLKNGNYGYMEYAKALDCRRYQLFDTVKEETAWQDYGKFMITGFPGIASEEEGEAQFTTAYQGTKALEISTRLDAIKKEKDTAKQTLDKTLAAYEELKTAWPMHMRYIEIYKSLEKYRDKLVEVRHQVEDFPSKFIDATTSKCT